ncbi:MAG: PEP-CTERM sorting domain-containing protein [Gemmatimonadaceae bacterium]
MHRYDTLIKRAAIPAPINHAPRFAEGDLEVDVFYYEWEGSHTLDATIDIRLTGAPTAPVVGTPEPASIALLATGFGLGGGAGCRRRKKA